CSLTAYALLNNPTVFAVLAPVACLPPGFPVECLLGHLDALRAVLLGSLAAASRPTRHVSGLLCQVLRRSGSGSVWRFVPGWTVVGAVMTPAGQYGRLPRLGICSRLKGCQRA